MELTTDDLRRARIYITRPDLCTVPGCIEWITALLDEVERLRTPVTTEEN